MTKNKYIVGKIEGNNVFYIPEKDIIFCKNTSIKYNIINRILFKSDLDREEIKEKNLTITKEEQSISFGCLFTTKDNIIEIKKQIKKIKNDVKYRSVNATNEG